MALFRSISPWMGTSTGPLIPTLLDPETLTGDGTMFGFPCSATESVDRCWGLRAGTVIANGSILPFVTLDGTPLGAAASSGSWSLSGAATPSPMAGPDYTDSAWVDLTILPDADPPEPILAGTTVVTYADGGDYTVNVWVQPFAGIALSAWTYYQQIDGENVFFSIVEATIGYRFWVDWIGTPPDPLPVDQLSSPQVGQFPGSPPIERVIYQSLAPDPPGTPIELTASDWSTPLLLYPVAPGAPPVAYAEMSVSAAVLSLFRWGARPAL